MTQRVYEEMSKRLKAALENNQEYTKIYGDMTSPAKNVSQYLNNGDVLRQMYNDPSLADMKQEIWEAINEVTNGLDNAIDERQERGR